MLGFEHSLSCMFMDSTLVHLVIFFTIGAAIGYLTYLLSGSEGRNAKVYMVDGRSCHYFSFGLYHLPDFYQAGFTYHWPMAISVVSAICIVVASFLYWYLRKKGDHSSWEDRLIFSGWYKTVNDLTLSMPSAVWQIRGYVGGFSRISTIVSSPTWIQNTLQWRATIVRESDDG